VVEGDAIEKLRGLNVRVLERKGTNPPEISGEFSASGLDPIPFFYKFPSLEYDKRIWKQSADIRVDGTKFPGLISTNQGNRFIALIAVNMFKTIAYLLSGTEASVSNSKRHLLENGFGRIDETKTAIVKSGHHLLPVVSVYEKLLLELLQNVSRATGMPIVQKGIYPKNSRGTICLTHDLDFIIGDDPKPYVSELIHNFRVGGTIPKIIMVLVSIILNLPVIQVSPLSLIPKTLLEKLVEQSSTWNFWDYLRIEKSFNATSSFYFLPRQSSKDSDYTFEMPLVIKLIKAVKDQGCEVGLHTSFNSYFSLERMRQEKNRLERISRSTVIGVRNHFLRLRIPTTWQIQDELGFDYDTTYGYARTIGFRAGTGLPYNLCVDSNQILRLLEVPLVIMDRTLFDELKLSYNQALKICKEIIDTAARYDSLVTILWHHNLDYRKAYLCFYAEILRYAQRQGLLCTSVAQMVRWWKMRRQVSFQRGNYSDSCLRMRLRSEHDFAGMSIHVYLPLSVNEVSVRVRGRKLGSKDINVKRNERSTVVRFCFDAKMGDNDLEILLA
jgi:hypothetical protein